MLIIERNGSINKSGVFLKDNEILKYIDESFYVNYDGKLKKEITLKHLREVLKAYPSLLTEFKYLNDLIVLGSHVDEDTINKNPENHMVCYTEEIENKKIDNLNIVVDGEEYSTVFMKMKELYYIPIRFGLIKKPENVNDIEVMNEESVEIAFSNFLNIVNIEMDFMSDEEIDYYKNNSF